MSHVTRLPGTTRLFLAGNTVYTAGTGLALPFLLRMFRDAARS